MNTTFSSTQLARLLGVNESTIKRWADSGYIDCVKTRGGHRRFSTSAVMKFVQENKLVLPELASSITENDDLRAHLAFGSIEKLAPPLKSAALAGNEEAVVGLLRSAIAVKPALLELFEKVVFPPLVEIGNAWQEGTISVDTEHLAAQTIRNALVRLQSEIHHEPPNGLTTVCCCYEDELHDIVVLCSSYYLLSRGWKTLFLGQMTPTQALLKIVRELRPELVVINGVTLPNPRRFPRDMNQILFPVIRRMGGKMLIGGPEIKARFGARLKADLLAASITDLERIADPGLYSTRKSKKR